MMLQSQGFYLELSCSLVRSYGTIKSLLSWSMSGFGMCSKEIQDGTLHDLNTKGMEVEISEIVSIVWYHELAQTPESSK